MKVRLSEGLTQERIGQSSLYGRQLVEEGDGMGHVVYQMTCQAGVAYNLTSPYGEGYSHVYYVSSAKGQIKSTNGTEVTVAPDTVIAMNGDVSADMVLNTASTVFGIFTPCQADVNNKKLLVRRLSDILGTNRDVDWKRGRSRRFLNRSDGFNISVHNTHAYKHNRNGLEYKNHFESVVWYEGIGRYEWGDGKMMQSFDLSPSYDVPDFQTVTMVLDKHDSHTAAIEDRDAYSVCVFSPPLVGYETHNFESGKSTSHW